jgi:hypothetical protein
VFLVGDQVFVEAVGEQVAHEGAELFEVLDAVGALPLGVAPLGVGDVAPAGEAAPVGFGQFLAHVGVGL